MRQSSRLLSSIQENRVQPFFLARAKLNDLNVYLMKSQSVLSMWPRPVATPDKAPPRQPWYKNAQWDALVQHIVPRPKEMNTDTLGQGEAQSSSSFHSPYW